MSTTVCSNEFRKKPHRVLNRSNASSGRNKALPSTAPVHVHIQLREHLWGRPYIERRSRRRSDCHRSKRGYHRVVTLYEQKTSELVARVRAVGDSLNSAIYMLGHLCRATNKTSTTVHPRPSNLQRLAHAGTYTLYVSTCIPFKLARGCCARRSAEMQPRPNN